MSEEERRRRGSNAQAMPGNVKQSPAQTRTAESLSSVNDRNVLKRHTMLVKQVMALLQRNAVMLFSDCAKEIKPVVEICEITSGDTAAIVLSQVSERMCWILIVFLLKFDYLLSLTPLAHLF